MTFVRSTILLAALSLLAACHGSSPKGDRRSASGEVLQGSVSDAMLPLDKLKSQGPMLAPSEEKSTPEGQADEGSTKGSTGAADASSDTSDAPDAAATSAAPAATPSGAP